MPSAPAVPVSRTINYSDILPLSSKVSFFQSIPRWNVPKFDLSRTYFIPAALSALIPIIAGAAVLLFQFLALILRRTVLYDRIEVRLDRTKRYPKRYWPSLLTSCILLPLPALFLGLGLAGNAVLLHSLRDALDILSSLLARVSRTGFAIADIVIFLVRRLREADPNEAVNLLPQREGFDAKIAQPVLRVMKEYGLKRMPNVEELRKALTVLVQRLESALTASVTYASVVHGALGGLLALQLLAPVAAFLAEFCGTYCYSILLLFPVLSAWALLGAVSAAGGVVADVCMLTKGYRNVLLGKGERVNGNALVDLGFICLESTTQKRVQVALKNATKPLAAESVAVRTIEALLRVPQKDFVDGVQWTAREVSKLVDCNTLVNASGRLQHVVCGSHSESAVHAIFDLYVAFFGLAVALTVGFFVVMAGIRPAWPVLVWPDAKDDNEDSDKSTDALDLGDALSAVSAYAPEGTASSSNRSPASPATPDPPDEVVIGDPTVP